MAIDFAGVDKGDLSCPETFGEGSEPCDERWIGREAHHIGHHIGVQAPQKRRRVRCICRLMSALFTLLIVVTHKKRDYIQDEFTVLLTCPLCPRGSNG